MKLVERKFLCLQINQVVGDLGSKSLPRTEIDGSEQCPYIDGSGVKHPHQEFLLPYFVMMG